MLTQINNSVYKVLSTTVDCYFRVTTLGQLRRIRTTSQRAKRSRWPIAPWLVTPHWSTAISAIVDHLDPEWPALRLGCWPTAAAMATTRVRHRSVR